jgi:hypothetical protein
MHRGSSYVRKYRTFSSLQVSEGPDFPAPPKFGNGGNSLCRVQETEKEKGFDTPDQKTHINGQQRRKYWKMNLYTEKSGQNPMAAA